MRPLHVIVCALTVASCGSDGPGLVLGPTQRPSEGCDFSPEALPHAQTLVIDVGESTRFQVPLLFENTSGRALQVIGADLFWACEAGQSPLRVPALSARSSFCRRHAEDVDFVGFDLLPATSPLVLPGERGVAYTEIVTDFYGQAFDQMFDTAIEADACLAARNPPDSSAPSCQALFEAPHLLDPEQIVAIAEFARYDGRYFDEVLAAREGASTDAAERPAYPMTIRAQLEIRDENGGEDFTQDVDVNVALCRHCGAPGATGRQPRDGYGCYHPMD